MVPALRHFPFSRQISHVLHWGMLPDIVRQTIHKRMMLRPGDRVLAGVSGGADSVCLLLVLRKLGYAVAVGHRNRGLRGAESDADETFVRELAERLDVPYYSRRADLANAPGNIEAQGREQRRAFFADLIREFGFDRIALAHNQNDRV